MRLLGAVPIVRGTGPHYDEGELLRWLAESAWLPTNLLPSGRVVWAAIDDHSARLTFTRQGQSTTLLVRFNKRDEIAECEALRCIDETTQRPWQGRYRQYRQWHSVFIANVLEASWVIDGQRQPYARFVVRELDYKPLRPY